MKVALAHHWLASYRGGEKVLEQMAALYPKSDIYTLVRNPKVEIPGLAIPGVSEHTFHTSRLQRFPKATSLYRHLLPLHPWAIENFHVAPDVDVLLSSDASLIKGINAPSVSQHICYCHSPPRYLWEMSAAYKKTSLAARIALDRCAPRLRDWDYQAAQSVTHFIANSNFVADRISNYYNRPSKVIYPPVAVDDFRHDSPRQSFYLVISELVSYKRIDLAVEAFNNLGKKLIVIGDGPERKRLESIAKPNIEFLGRQPFAELKARLQVAKAFIFPGIEDFGITPVESQASGCPVIAFRAGGALETVLDGKTGVFFDEQNAGSLADAITQFDSSSISADDCAKHAQGFSAQRFQREYSGYVNQIVHGSETPAIDELITAGG